MGFSVTFAVVDESLGFVLGASVELARFEDGNFRRADANPRAQRLFDALSDGLV